MKFSPLFLLAVLFFAMNAQAQPALILPTENDHLYRGGGAAYYMYVDRNFQGAQTKPWEAGQYGNVRNPQESAAGIIYTRFHEGIDIKPMRRDAQGVPLDPVLAVDEGRVVYVNDVAGRSNYGKYVVVEHVWDGCPYYSLYAHLRVASVQAGQRVAQGAPLGILGWTGSGLNKTRAHLHFEINLLVNDQFEGWYAVNIPGSPNHHGKYNGLNLFGIDVAAFYLARKKNPSLRIAEFLQSEQTFFRVAMPAGRGLDILKRYPWLAGDKAGAHVAAWEVHFNQVGIPIKAEPYGASVPASRLSGIRTAKVPYQHLTRRLVAGGAGSARLSETGERTMRLFTHPN